MYWDINRPLSYNCLFNFIVGARGVGKTYGAKMWAIKDFLKNGGQFVYVRRYKEEMKKLKKFFDDIEDAFPDHEFRVAPPIFYIDEKVAGTAVALSVAKVEKSTPYPDVNKIIFDEFILDKGFHHYLPDEVTNFLELYSTVARSRDVRVMFLSNALTVTNPYFIYFNLSLPYGKNITAKDDILLEVVKEDEFSDMMKQTRFGRLVAGTPYGDYAIDNDFLRDDYNFIEKHGPTAKYQFTMTYKGSTFGVWIDYTQGKQYVSDTYDPSCPITYAITLDDHTPNTMLLKGRKSIFIESFIKYYTLGLVRFENMNTKNICNEIIKLTL